MAGGLPIAPAFSEGRPAAASPRVPPPPPAGVCPSAHSISPSPALVNPLLCLSLRVAWSAATLSPVENLPSNGGGGTFTREVPEDPLRPGSAVLPSDPARRARGGLLPRPHPARLLSGWWRLSGPLVFSVGVSATPFAAWLWCSAGGPRGKPGPQAQLGGCAHRRREVCTWRGCARVSPLC